MMHTLTLACLGMLCFPSRATDGLLLLSELSKESLELESESRRNSFLEKTNLRLRRRPFKFGAAWKEPERSHINVAVQYSTAKEL